MRKRIAAGNWKMNLGPIAAQKFVAELLASYAANCPKKPEMILAVPYLDIVGVAAQLKGHPTIGLAAQNVHQEESGAFTGEISAGMLAEAGCKYVLVGHSERREYFGEANALLLRKLKQALKHDLTPIYCFGETLAEREAGKTFAVIDQQVKDAIYALDISEFSHCILAYEPVWAIGTGKVATPAQAQEVHAHVRKLLATKFGPNPANATTILYGGSVKPDNAHELFACPDIDGGLVGGASLKVSDFVAIANGL
jgi:triosephosphate isomerase (TIM)